MLVVSSDTCPSQARTVLMSTPARSRCVAVVWRIVWGLIRFVASEGIPIWALHTYRSTSVLDAKARNLMTAAIEKNRRGGAAVCVESRQFRNGGRPQWTVTLFTTFAADFH